MSLTLGSPEIRREIDYVVETYRISEWPSHLPAGISLLATGSPNKFCEHYAFGLADVKNTLLEMFPDIRVPKQGDIVCYCKTSEEGVIHVGRYQADGSVKSKWGMGPMFRHPVEYVPTCFGCVAFFRRATRKELQSLPEMAIQKRRDMFMEKYVPTKNSYFRTSLPLL